MNEDTIKFIQNGTEEFIEKDYNVTIEMSLQIEKVDETIDWINNNIDLPENTAWIAMECETCQEHHGDNYCHFSLEVEDRFKTLTRMSNLVNFIKMTGDKKYPLPSADEILEDPELETLKTALRFQYELNPLTSSMTFEEFLVKRIQTLNKLKSCNTCKYLDDWKDESPCDDCENFSKWEIKE